MASLFHVFQVVVKVLKLFNPAEWCSKAWGLTPKHWSEHLKALFKRKRMHLEEIRQCQGVGKNWGDIGRVGTVLVGLVSLLETREMSTRKAT